MKKYLSDLTSEYVASILDYSPETGIFIWKYRPNGYAPWNGRYAGTKASTLNVYGYNIIAIDGKKYKASRLAFLIMTGQWPKYEIDHRNLDHKNDKWENLREATPSQNQHNRGLNKNNTSGFKGVVWDKANKKWMASLTMKGKHRYLGRFSAVEQARAAYRDEAIKTRGEFARVA